MPPENTLPSAAPLSQTRATRARRFRYTPVVAALVLGAAITGGVVAAAQPGIPTGSESSASAEQEEGPVALSIGNEAMDEAETALSKAERALDGATAGVDTDRLASYVDKLSDYEDLPHVSVVGLTADAASEADAVVAETAQVREEAAAEKERAAQEKKKAEAAAAAVEEAASAARTPEGAQDAAAEIAADEFGWGSGEFSCLSNLWSKESGWDYQATNGSSGAYGIPQALPGSKMDTVASDWETNPLTQIRWGLTYIADAYGTPCSAWGHSQAMNWY
ncbi:MAG: phospholipase [Microbacterium sp.]